MPVWLRLYRGINSTNSFDCINGEGITSGNYRHGPHFNPHQITHDFFSKYIKCSRAHTVPNTEISFLRRENDNDLNSASEASNTSDSSSDSHQSCSVKRTSSLSKKHREAHIQTVRPGHICTWISLFYFLIYISNSGLNGTKLPNLVVFLTCKVTEHLA
ncbi:hypothetical protein VP01_2032g1 [Puccinia sorghi]|uniref:Uncharacterized protein n=1 Tax=Puccinia sorghi TaxID=27349 RepID=A0A0L6VAY5_9BASI|nr:hypothetical protein VP01_2032g1 [Puccinia sorghi]